MKRLQSVYLDTSVISALFDDRTPERRQFTEDSWEKLENYDVYASTIVTEEINAVSEGLREKMMDKLSGFELLLVTAEVEDLAEEYVKRAIFPERYKSDALHVAVAVVNDINFLISWNFKHLVKVKTRRIVNLVNEVLDYSIIEIIAPPEL